MPQALDLIRQRRRAKAKRFPHLVPLLTALAILVVLAGGTLVLIFAVAYTDLTTGFPDVMEMELVFGASGAETFQPLRLYTRDGETLVFEAAHPATEARKWLRIRPGGVSTIPAHAIQATLAAQDESFWENPGYSPGLLNRALQALLFRQDGEQTRWTITQRLAASQLLPLDRSIQPEWIEEIRSALLAAELTRIYSKEQILEWYLNSAVYGDMVFGVDAAALFYFDKHASALELSESAALAAIASMPDVHPIRQAQDVRKRQIEVLNRMVDLGWISEVERTRAIRDKLVFEKREQVPRTFASDFGWYVWNHIGELLGPHARARARMQVTTTLDYDLQLQTYCAAQSHLARLSGEQAGLVVQAQDGSACIAAGLLPTLRPGDVGLDHKVSEAAVLVLDAANGEILSMFGPAADLHPTGTAFLPFIYVTAFAQGYSPAAMVLDIPVNGFDSAATRTPPSDESIPDMHGPVRMRTALANAYTHAAVRTLNLIGPESVLRTAQHMGFSMLSERESDYADMLETGGVQSSLLELGFAYSMLANQGRMSGVAFPSDGAETGQTRLAPLAVLRVEDAAGRWVYDSDPQVRSVLSPQLAYLVEDVLSDEAARWPTYGQGNILEIGRPAGAQTGLTTNMQDNWALGFTPSLVVGVWVGNLEDRAMQGVHALNGAAPIWHAAIRYATRDLPRQGWSAPAGINIVDVCDPSGLLPTEYCPTIVREPFITGTEPTTSDNLYQPFLVNKETGKLATLSTPLEVVEERVYMIPPPGAEAWADLQGLEQPPDEYDTIYESTAQDPSIWIRTPEAFETIRGSVVIRGTVQPQEFELYRLQYGSGLNPVRWIQIGEDVFNRVSNAALGRWETDGLNGLYTLQLLVVGREGQIKSTAVHVTIDNAPPQVELVAPRPGLVIDLDSQEQVVLEAQVVDELRVDRVIFYINGEPVATITSAPFSTRWVPEEVGDYVVYVEAFDAAGNSAQSERVVFGVTR